MIRSQLSFLCLFVIFCRIFLCLSGRYYSDHHFLCSPRRSCVCTSYSLSCGGSKRVNRLPDLSGTQFRKLDFRHSTLQSVNCVNLPRNLEEIDLRNTSVDVCQLTDRCQTVLRNIRLNPVCVWPGTTPFPTTERHLSRLPDVFVPASLTSVTSVSPVGLIQESKFQAGIPVRTIISIALPVALVFCVCLAVWIVVKRHSRAIRRSFAVGSLLYFGLQALGVASGSTAVLFSVVGVIVYCLRRSVADTADGFARSTLLWGLSMAERVMEWIWDRITVLPRVEFPPEEGLPRPEIRGVEPETLEIEEVYHDCVQCQQSEEPLTLCYQVEEC